MTTVRDFDIVLFGATGFTGGLVATYLATAAANRPLRWALAGRNREKLESVRAGLGSQSGTAPELLVADAGDADAMFGMAGRARVVITTVGPYMKYGEPLVRACAQVGTDYVDLTGEPAFVDAMRARYHESAQRRRVKIVHACGFDSIPYDLGAHFALQALRRRMSDDQRQTAAVTIEGFVLAKGTVSGGTLHSALEIMASTPGRARRRRKKPAVRQGPRNASRLPLRISYRRDLGFWAVPMPTIDPEIVVHSGALLPEYGPDFHYGQYVGIKHAPQLVGLLLGVGTLFTLAQLAPARALLRRLKDSGEGPDEETRDASYFRVLLVARADEHEVRCEVRGGDPGYGETSKMLAESALCLAFDREQLPEYYGVVPTAAALGNPLIGRLQAAGIIFREL